MKYLIIDANNLFYRGRHSVSKSVDMWSKLGLSVNIILASANKAIRTLECDHVVFAFDSKSWRKELYSPYKMNRQEIKAAKTSNEQEEDALFFEAFNDLSTFLKEHTACTTIQVRTAEADDIIARWINLHPHDSHVILSSDSDFYQLITDNVSQFNGISNEHITINGIFDEHMKPINDKKTGAQKTIGDPKYVLFEKCMRGDTSDNIFSAYPGVRKKGSKNNVGLIEAYADIDKKGYAWNALMLHRWVDHENAEHRVLDDYIRNRSLIDLNDQPDNIKSLIDGEIKQQIKRNDPPMIGAHLLKFCGKYELNKISEQSTFYLSWMKKAYKGNL